MERKERELKIIKDKGNFIGGICIIKDKKVIKIRGLKIMSTILLNLEGFIRNFIIIYFAKLTLYKQH